MLLIIDNYDSFTYNLYQAFAQWVPNVVVARNDQLTLEQIEAMGPKAMVLSPGPGWPMDAGICVPLIQAFAPKIPILGICLGHQALSEAFGGKVVHASEMMHGRNSMVFHRQQGLFEGLPLPLKAGRYHSLVVDRDSLPACLTVEAETADGVIMALAHKDYPCFGLQFHPESIMTPHGRDLMAHFVEVAGC